MQTDLEPNFQELFFENLPYQPQEPVHASKLPTTTVRHCLFFVCQISVVLEGAFRSLVRLYL